MSVMSQHHSLESRVATTEQTTVVIKIQRANGRSDSKTAKRSWCDGLSKMTEACLTSLGHSVPHNRRIKLWCTYQWKNWLTEFDVVENATTDVSLCEKDCEAVHAGSQTPGSFPTEATIKDPGE